MNTKARLPIMAFSMLALAGGCLSDRNSAVPMVRDVGADVATRYRYRVTRVYEGETSDVLRLPTGFLRRHQPGVFSPGGIPVVLRITSPRVDASASWTTLLSMCTIGAFPMLNETSYTFNCSVELFDEKGGNAPFELVSRHDSADTWLPTAFLLYNGTPDFDGCRVFCEHVRKFGDKNYYYSPCEWDMNTAKLKSIDNLVQQALAYAVAVKLKELEDAGKVEAMLRKAAEARSIAPAHRVVRLEREPGSDFIHSFAIEMLQKPDDERTAIKAVFSEFIESLKQDYLDTFPSAKKEALVVSISRLKREGLRISGRAAVLTIKPLSLTYDANTRRGKLSVRFNAGQAEEARTWILRNVKTLAHDKNIALVTGRLPPEATFRTLGEKVDGDVMEIEFKTE